MWSKRTVCGGCGVFVNEYPFSRCQNCRQKDEQNFPNINISKRIRYIIEQKSKPCIDCHMSYPYYIMQFDHIPGSHKKFNVSQAVTSKKSLDQIKEEIAKCELVCANCHAFRTHKRSVEARNLRESEYPEPL
jgi:hypothetical protein